MRRHRLIALILQAPICFAIAVSCTDNRVSEPGATAAPTSLIATVAGSRLAFSGDNGPADQANLNGPDAIAVDARGSLYIADALNQRIRRVDEAGTITTPESSAVEAQVEPLR